MSLKELSKRVDLPTFPPSKESVLSLMRLKRPTIISLDSLEMCMSL